MKVETKELSYSASNSLHLLRIVAAWSVLLGHSFLFYQISVFKNQDYFPYIQNMGVVILFVLSGFFTMYSIERKKLLVYDFKSFFIEKVSRIGVPYIAALVVVCIIDFINITKNTGGGVLVSPSI